MKRLFTSTRYLLGATTLLAVGASAALAQDTSKARPRSSQRIPISKDAPTAGTRTSSGAIERVTTARVDTVTVYKTDTLRTTTQLPGRVDTLRTTNTVTVHDTVTLQPPPRVVPSGRRVFRSGRRMSAPNGALFNPMARAVDSGATGLAGTRQSPWHTRRRARRSRVRMRCTRDIRPTRTS
jgi:hypothetical protein